MAGADNYWFYVSFVIGKWILWLDINISNCANYTSESDDVTNDGFVLESNCVKRLWRVFADIQIFRHRGFNKQLNLHFAFNEEMYVAYLADSQHHRNLHQYNCAATN